MLAHVINPESDKVWPGSDASPGRVDPDDFAKARDSGRSTMSNGVEQDPYEASVTRGFNALWAERYHLARGCFEEAVGLDPADPFALLELARCCHALNDTTGRDRALTRVWPMFKQDARIALVYAQCCEKMRMQGQALAAYAQACKQRDTPPGHLSEAYACWADLLERMNRLEQARAKAGLALQRPGRVGARLQCVRARLLMRAGDFDGAIGLIEADVRRALDGSGRIDPATVSLCYVYAKALDRVGEPSDVMAALEQLKQRLSADAQSSVSAGLSEKLIQESREAAEAFTPSDVSRWRASLTDSGQATADPVFLAGHPRSGTTLAGQLIDANDRAVVISESRAFLNAVADVAESLSDRRLTQRELIGALPDGAVASIRAGYLGRVEAELGDRLGGSLLIDKNPVLTAWVPLILRVFPSARFITMSRDPRAVCLSAYMNDMGINPWSVNWTGLEQTCRYYAAVIDVWRIAQDRLAPDCLELRYEDCVRDHVMAAKTICGFLGIGWQPSQAHPERHAANKTVFSPTYADVAQPVYRHALDRWRRYESYLPGAGSPALFNPESA